MSPFGIPNEPSAAFADQAEPDAVDFDALVAAFDLTGVVSGCAVTAQGAPDMTVAVAAGTVEVAGGAVAVTAGNVTIGAAHATNPRFDLVVVNNAGTKSVVAGTASANPVFPAIPASSVLLAAVYVPANDTTINSNQIIDKRIIVRAAAAGSTIVKRKTANEDVVSSAVLQDDNDLLFAVGANEGWAFELFLVAAEVGGAGGEIKYTMVGPAGSTILWNSLVLTAGNITALLPPQAGGATSTHDLDTTDRAFWIRGTIINGGTPGNCVFQWCQNVSDVLATRVKANSHLVATKV